MHNSGRLFYLARLGHEKMVYTKPKKGEFLADERVNFVPAPTFI